MSPKKAVEYLPGPLQIVKQSHLTDGQQRIEEAVALDVQANIEEYIQRFCAMKRAYGGRFISSDDIKELFAPYAESPATRTKFTYAVHHTSAALSSEIFQRKLREADADSSQVLLVTGPPGAGKTIATSRRPQLSKCVFESNISDSDVAKRRVEEIVNAGCQPTVLAVYADPVTCLRRVISRAVKMGRVVRLEAIVRLHALLPATLRMLSTHYRSDVEIGLIDNSQELVMPRFYMGLAKLSSLEYTGSIQELEDTLLDELESQYKAGHCPEDVYAEIRGKG